MEVWKPVKGFNGYEVSSFGRVRSYWRRGHKRIFETPRLIKPALGGHGYYVVNLKGVVKCVHEIVCEAFYGDRKQGYEVAHNDGSRTNNCAENLRWATRAENISDAFKHKTRGSGEKSNNVKLTYEQVKQIRALRREKGWGAQRIGKTLGIPKSRVGNVIYGKSWASVS